MNIQHDFGVTWQNIYGDDGKIIVKVVIYMPLEIANLERPVIEGIENTIKDYQKPLDDKA